MERALAMIEPVRWRRLAVLSDAVALQASAISGVLIAGHGSISTPGASLATIYVAFVLCLMGMSHRTLGRVPGSGIHPCVEALRSCTIGMVLAIATESLLGGGQLASTSFEIWCVTVATVCTVRLALVVAGRNARRRGTLLTPTLVVGAGVVGTNLAQHLAERPEYGLRPVGFLDADPPPGILPQESQPPLLGGPEDLEEACARTGARHVILAFTHERDHRHVALLKRCQQLGLGVSVVPRLYESLDASAQLDHIGGMPLLSLRAPEPNGLETVKQAIDRLGTSITLPLTGERSPAAPRVALAGAPDVAPRHSSGHSAVGAGVAPGPALRLIENEEIDTTTVWFCGYCGTSTVDGLAPPPVARVCRSCEQGLMLEAQSEAAPAPAEPFLVVDGRLTVQAVSQHAEQVLGVLEEDATDRPVTELLVGADAGSEGDGGLANLLVEAAESAGGAQCTFVRPRDTYGVRLRARITACGPPRAALIVFESTPTRPAPLRLVRESLPLADHG